MNNIESLDKKFRALYNVPSLSIRHNSDEARFVMEQLFALKVPGIMVELGAYRGGMTVKLSCMAAATGRRLHVFDSFCGMPKHKEKHGKTTDGRIMGFPPGDFWNTSLQLVKEHVEQHGDLSVCEFHRGYFEDTLPWFSSCLRESTQRIAFVFCDVDLAMSTRACLTHLWSLMAEDGIWITHDGLFPWCLSEYAAAGVSLLPCGKNKALSRLKIIRKE